MNIFTFLLLKYPNKGWNMEWVSANPNIDMKFILDNPQIEWKWYNGISKNPNLTMYFIDQFYEENWNWNYISQHLFITREFIDKYEYKLNFKYLSRNKHISLEFIDKFPYYNWKINGGLTHNPNLNMDYILQNKNYIWIFDLISENPNFLLEDIDRYPNFFWNWNKILKYNENITISFFKKYQKKFSKDYYHYLSNKKNITMDIIENNSYIPWNYGKNGISDNPNLTLKFLRYNFFSHYNAFNKHSICSNPNFTIKNITNNINLFNSLGGISENENLTAKYINKNINCTDFNGNKFDWIDFYYFSRNKLTVYTNKILEIKNHIRCRKELFDSINCKKKKKEKKVISKLRSIEI